MSSNALYKPKLIEKSDEYNDSVSYKKILTINCDSHKLYRIKIINEKLNSA